MLWKQWTMLFRELMSMTLDSHRVIELIIDYDIFKLKLKYDSCGNDMTQNFETLMYRCGRKKRIKTNKKKQRKFVAVQRYIVEQVHFSMTVTYQLKRSLPFLVFCLFLNSASNGINNVWREYWNRSGNQRIYVWTTKM